MSDQGRRRLSIVLAGLASLLAVLALVAAYALHAGVNSDQFANRATVALRDDNVSNLVAQKITDDVVLKKDQDLLAARPLIESVTSGIVGSRPFTDLFRSAVGDVHRALFAGDKDTVTLTVPDVGTVLEAALEKLKPALAADLDLAGRVELVQRDIGSVGGGLAHLAHTVRVLGWILFALCLLFAGGAIWVAPDRRDAVVALGVGAAVAGGALVVLYAIGRSIAIHHVSGPSGQAAAAGVWDAFLGDLQTEAWILAGAGAVVAAAASSLIRPPEIGAPLRGLADRLAVEPQTRTGQALRAGAFVVAGVIVLTQADAVIRIAITIAGLYLIYEGVAAGLKLMYRPRPADDRGLREEIEGELEELFRPTRAHHVIAGGVVVIVVAGALTVWLGSGSGTIAAPATGACEGNAALCDRSLEQIALPATHNAMSVPLPGWYSAEQDRPIADQLNDGIRGLLLDTHYGDKLPDGAVRTELGKTSKVANQDAVSPQAVEAAKRIRNNLGFAGEGERGMYLCHTFCEIGATPLDSVLGDIHDFLITHPDAVLVVINEDYVKPADFVDAVDRAGLAHLAYRGPVGIGEWPTLQEMIDSGQRVVFFAENRAGAAPWYRPAYKSIVEETPYTFRSASLLTDQANLAESCAPNRGPKKAALFLVNHWVSTDPIPKPSDADTVNAEDVLLQRLRECERIRHHIPNLVAVNFYRHGDLFKAVDELNGLSPPEP